jgi:Ca2+/Na+ antiporter
MYLKHIFGLLTVIIFVILASPLKDDSFEKIIFLSSILYVIFLFLVKTDYRIFLLLLLILVFLYILELKKSKVIEKDKDKEKEKEILMYDRIMNLLTYSFYFLLPIGFISYLGQKKKEYKGNFKFLKFMFGTPKCKENFSNDSIMDGLKHVFD